MDNLPVYTGNIRIPMWPQLNALKVSTLSKRFTIRSYHKCMITISVCECVCKKDW